MGGPIDMERKGYELIGCYTYFVNLSYDLVKILYLRNGRADSSDMEPKGCESIGC